MRPGRPATLTSLAALALAIAAALAACGAQRPGAPAGDPLAAEVARWSAFVAADTAGDDNSVQIRRVTTPALAEARASLAAGRRLHALLRLGAARAYLAALAYTREHPQASRSQEALEAEWKRAGTELLAETPEAAARSLAHVRPAAVRAMGEAAVPAVRISYDASIEYARATVADAGLFYLGQAVAQQQFVAFCGSLAETTSGPEPAFRRIGAEIDTLQRRMLAVYRPPVSIDRHPEFIGASAALKEARELDERGLPRGALLRYLQAALRFQPLRGTPPAFDPVATPAKLREYAARFGKERVDHSLGRLFLEVAESDLADTTAAATHATAAAVAEVVLPLYLEALEPAKVASAAPAASGPQVTVTLVRWPYT